MFCADFDYAEPQYELSVDDGELMHGDINGERRRIQNASSCTSNRKTAGRYNASKIDKLLRRKILRIAIWLMSSSHVNEQQCSAANKVDLCDNV